MDTGRAKRPCLQTIVEPGTQYGPRGVLAGKGQHARRIRLDLQQQSGHIECVPGQFIVVPRMALGQIGEADAEFRQKRKFRGCQKTRCQSGLEKRPPKQIARVGVVGPFLGGSLAGRRAAKHQP